MGCRGQGRTLGTRLGGTLSENFRKIGVWYFLKEDKVPLSDFCAEMCTSTAGSDIFGDPVGSSRNNFENWDPYEYESKFSKEIRPGLTGSPIFSGPAPKLFRNFAAGTNKSKSKLGFV